MILVMKTILQTVLEMPEFIRQTESCMDEVSKKSFIDYIAAHPLEGDVIVGAGGIVTFHTKLHTSSRYN